MPNQADNNTLPAYVYKALPTPIWGAAAGPSPSAPSQIAPVPRYSPMVRLIDALTGAGLPVVGLAGPTPAESNGIQSTSYQRPEGWVRVDWSAAPTATQASQAGQIVAAFDIAATPAELLRTVGTQGNEVAALCLLLSPTQLAKATANQKAAAQAVVDAVAAKALAVLPA